MINSYRKTQTNIQKLIEQSLLGVRQNQNTSRAAPNVSSAPIVTLVDRIIQSALALRASDIHLDPVENQVRVRLRIDGRLSELPPALPLELKDILLARIKVMAQLDTTVHHLPLDGRITYPSIYHAGVGRGKNCPASVESGTEPKNAGGTRFFPGEYDAFSSLVSRAVWAYFERWPG